MYNGEDFAVDKAIKRFTSNEKTRANSAAKKGKGDDKIKSLTKKLHKLKVAKAKLEKKDESDEDNDSEADERKERGAMEITKGIKKKRTKGMSVTRDPNGKLQIFSKKKGPTKQKSNTTNTNELGRSIQAETADVGASLGGLHEPDDWHYEDTDEEGGN